MDLASQILNLKYEIHTHFKKIDFYRYLLFTCAAQAIELINEFFNAVFGMGGRGYKMPIL